jgi:hypothetical protein
MQPTTEEPPAGTSGWAGPTYAPPAAATTVRKGRPWLIAIVSTLTLLVLIAAIGNQWVTDKIADHVGGESFSDRFLSGLTTYSWRFSPRGGHDVDRLWLASVVMIAAVLVLTLLLVAAICRGNGAFGQAFLGAWAVVVVATLLAVYLRSAVVDSRRLMGRSVGTKAESIFYSPLSPNTSHIIAALCFGFVVGLVAGLTAVLSRRTDVVAPPVPPGYGAPAFGPPRDPHSAAAVPGPIASPSPWDDAGDRDTDDRADDVQHTAAMPVVDDPSRDSTPDRSGEATTQLPRAGWQRGPEPDPSSDAQHTTELPRSTAPDDDPDGPRHRND